MTKMLQVYLATAFAAAIAWAPQAAPYSGKRSVLDSGGTSGSSSEHYATAASAGQSVIGHMRGPNHSTSIGFWGSTSFLPCSGVAPIWPPGAPTAFFMHQNFPNPFAASTAIVYGIPSRSHVSLDILDIRGRLVRRLADGWEDSGYHQLEWDSANDQGEHVAAGLYLCRFRSGGVEQLKKLLLIR